MGPKNNKIRIMMVGPGKEIIGGISSLVETIVPELQERVNLLYFQTVKGRNLKESGKVTLRNLYIALSQYTRFMKALLKFRPNIIHLHTSQGLGLLKDAFYVFLAKIKGCRFIVHIHAAELSQFCYFQSFIISKYIRKVLGHSDIIIAVSEEWRNQLLKVITNGNVLTFRNCINLNSFNVSFKDFLQSGMKILFIGSVGARKGAFDLLEAMGRPIIRNSSIKAKVVGYEEKEGDIERAIVRRSQLGLDERYQLVGTIVGEKKKGLLNEANVFVLPSHNEGLPMAILEAMASGLPIISTKVGGIPEVVKDGCNGFLIKPGDVDALADKIAFLSAHPSQCKIMGKNSRHIAECEFDVKAYIANLVSIYELILKNK